MTSKGYNAEFLGSTLPALPLPSFSERLKEDVLERDSLSPAPPDGRHIYRHYHNHTIVMSRRHRTAIFAALNVDQSLLEKTDKTADWRVDDQVGAENQLNGDYYTKNVWDKGHLAPDAAAGWGTTLEERIAATNDTYYYTNATLQHENFNRDEWKDLETWIRKMNLGEDSDGTGRKLSEITGPIFLTDSSKQKTIQPEGREEARIPDGFFKVIAYINDKKAQGGSLEVRCFVMNQDHEVLQDRQGEVDNQRYQVDIAKIEELTDLVFDPIYHQANKNTTTNLNEEDAVNIGSGVVIAAAMVNPTGKDSGNEWISLQNKTAESISLQGWKLQDQRGRSLLLQSSIIIDGDSSFTCHSISPVRLNNMGGTLTLYNAQGYLVDRVEYAKAHVKEGVAVNFHAHDK
jgi:endonuclease G